MKGREGKGKEMKRRYKRRGIIKGE